MSDTTHDTDEPTVAGESIRVLHLDDDRPFTEIVAEFLERQNDRFEVASETDPSSALERLAREQFDCIVTDYQMPGMDGIAFIRAVREDDADLPCIIYTGQGSEEVASEAISAGATDYLQKDSGTEQYELLANRVENAVESYRAERRARTLERVRSVARDVNKALIRTSSRGEIEASVCGILANADPYRGAWIGSFDPDAGRVEPRTVAGIDESYFEALSVDAGDATDCWVPFGSADGDEPITVVDDVAAALTDETHREIVVEHDVGALASIPLVYDGERYGCLVVYADRPGTFDEPERDLLIELADDIAYATHAVETRAALRRERDRRAALFDNAPNPIVEFSEADPTVVADVNPAFEETFGFEAADVVGRQAAEVLVPAEENDDHRAIVERAMDGEPVETEVRRQTADGVRDFLLTVSPAGEDDGAGVYGWYVDITDRKELAAELQEQVNLLDHIFGQIPTALYVKDTEGRHVRMSDYDVDPSDVIGKTDPEVYGESAFTRATYEDDMRVIQEGEPIINKEEYNPNNDEWTLTSKVPWYGDDGEIKGLIGVSRLITEKKEYERELERKNERLENFANVLSHDLRNPLNVASGQVELVRSETDDERLDRASDALDRMDDLIDDILSLAQQGWSVDETTTVTFSDVVERAWTAVETGEAVRRVESDCRFEADEGRLRQLLENLIRNAVEHGSTRPRASETPEYAVDHGSGASETADAATGDPVTVTFGALEDGFYVADDGPGIPDEDREAIFEAGYSTSPDGTGFGLAIVRDVADAHGWEVDVTDGDGPPASPGARFEFTGVDVRE